MKGNTAATPCRAITVDQKWSWWVKVWTPGLHSKLVQGWGTWYVKPISSNKPAKHQVTVTERKSCWMWWTLKVCIQHTSLNDIAHSTTSSLQCHGGGRRPMTRPSEGWSAHTTNFLLVGWSGPMSLMIMIEMMIIVKSVVARLAQHQDPQHANQIWRSTTHVSSDLHYPT